MIVVNVMLTKSKQSVFLFILLLLAQQVSAQFKSLRFDRITIEDGLPNPSAMDILQDSLGFIWISTLSGIVRYDGIAMKTYLPEATTIDSLPSRNIPNLYLDKAGNIWAGFQYSHIWPKLYRYEPATDRFEPYLFKGDTATAPVKRGISFLKEDKLGRLLVGTWGDGLYAVEIYKEAEGVARSDLPFQHFVHNPNDPNSLCNDAIGKGWATDQNGNIWMPTDECLTKFIPSENRFESFTFTSDTVAFANEFTVTMFEPPSRLWVGTILHGLLVFDTETESFIDQYKHDPEDPWSISPDAVWKIIKTHDGKYWLGVNGRIDLMDPVTRKFTHIKDEFHPDWEPHFHWNNSMIEDKGGNIWIATWQKGVYKYNPDKGQFGYVRPSDLGLEKDEQIVAQYVEPGGSVWFGTLRSGLIRWDKTRGTVEKPFACPSVNADVPCKNPRIVGQDSLGNYWVTSGSSLYKLNSKFEIIASLRPFGTGDIRATIVKDNELWVSSWEYPFLCKLQDEKRGSFDCLINMIGNEDFYSSIVKMSEGPEGRIWLGINQEGFHIFDEKSKTIKHYFPEFGVREFLFDEMGQVWLATHSAGLKLFNEADSAIVSLSPAVSKQLGIVSGLQSDRNGLLWMKTPSGIAKFDPQTKEVVSTFQRSLWQKEGEQWYGGGSVKAPEGELFFNSPDGVLYFHPDSINIDQQAPMVVIDGLEILHNKVLPGSDTPLEKEIALTKQLNLRYWQNDLTFHFAALHFKMPSENLISFRLDPFDERWSEPSRVNHAEYNNLPPGNYKLRVKAANSDGVWSEEKVLNLIIKRAWWTTWWAFLLYAVALFVLLYFIRKYELRQRAAKEEARRLAELDEVKSEFYTNITHEFRTPLTIILGLTEQLKSNATEGMKSTLEIVKRNGWQLLTLVNQILDISKIEAGVLDLNYVQADVIGYLKYLLESFSSLAKQKGIELSFSSDTERLVMDFDAERLQQIIGNLLSNAIKFTSSGGVVQLAAQKEGNFLKITVEDSGIGISSEHHKKIFSRYYQVDQGSTKTKTPTGSGIGLAMTRELVKAMRGKIWVESQVGLGSKFFVLLPITNTAKSDNSIRPTTGYDLPGKAAGTVPVMVKEASVEKLPKILLIEDNVDVLNYVTSCLQGRYSIEKALDGKVGVEKALQIIPDLIVSDVMMPELNGYEVCKRLKNDVRTSHIPIILLTAKADSDSRLAGIGEGADAYLVKPFDPKELRLRVRKLLELRKKLQYHYLHVAGVDTDTPNEKGEALIRENKFVENARDLVHTHLADPLFDVSFMCKELGMSRTQLHRKLTSLTGLSANQFIRAVRIKNAQDLLEKTSYSISEIAYQTGFSSPGYFTKVFKAETGKTPKQYRQYGP